MYFEEIEWQKTHVKKLRTLYKLQFLTLILVPHLGC
jgi:hypothetical protein